jgi:hypothetical protein
MVNKKAIMLKFLTTVLLSIIIFAPACAIGSKMFRLSSQAEENFIDVVYPSIKNFNEDSRIGEQKSVLLIMDKETVIVYFEKGNDNVVVNVDADIWQTDNTMTFLKPSDCSSDKNCICLFQSANFETGTLKDDFIISGGKQICKNLDFNLTLNSCTLGELHEAKSYECENGFIIERNFAKSTLDASSYYELYRRNTFYMNKSEAGEVQLQGELYDE